MLQECKIETGNWYWNRQVQLRLFELGVKWPLIGTKTFNVRKRGDYLFLTRNPMSDTWWLSWGRKFDWERCDKPATTAKLLLESLKSDVQKS
jgi:hypothetical protein